MLLSGEIHYARVPRGLWRDRLLKLRRASFNAVTMYFFWNFHEVSPGVFDFSGEKDFEEFIYIASSLGLKIIARVGPYVCAEWDNGGHPDWLISDDLIPRSLHPSYFRYAERWLRAVLSRLSKYDQSRGGPLVALQLENEYFWGDMPYHIEMARIARSLGITVDLYTNANRFARNSYYIDSVDLYPDVWRLDQVIRALKDLEKTQPGKRPKIMEYEGGWFSKITKPLPTERGSFPANWTRMLMATALAYGSDLISFYMFHGGTNFGYWTGRWITTTYDYEAAIREWGELSERYYKIKSLAQVAYLVDGSELISEELYGDRIKVIRSKDGAIFTFYINNTDSEWIHNGTRIPARDVRITASNLPLGSLRISSNLDILAVAGDTAIFYGDPGEPYWVEVSGGSISSCYRASYAGNRIIGSVEEISGCLVDAVEGIKRILVLDRRLAERTWFTEHYFIVSDVYFIEEADYSRIVAQILPGKARLYLPLKAGSYIRELGMGLIEVSVDAKPPLIEILGISRGGIKLSDLGSYDSHIYLEDAGIYEHGFYLYETISPRRSDAGLVVNDIAIVISDNKISAGYTWWGGEVGEGRVKIYVDSTGHPNDPDWSVTIFKTGLASPLLLGKVGEEEIRSWEHGIVDLSDRFPPGIASFNSHSKLVNIDIPNMVKEVNNWSRNPPNISSPLVIHYIRARIDSRGKKHAIIRLRNLKRILVIMLNGKVIYKGRGNDVFDTAVYAELSEGVNELIIGSPVYGARGEIQMPFTDAKIEFWEEAVKGYKLYRVLEGEAQEETKIPLRIDEPSTIRVRFRVNGGDSIAPIYLRISGDVVAQIYLNGRMIGHYYDRGSQDKFYLPEPYLSYDSENELKLIAIPTKHGAELSIEFGTYYIAKRVEIPLAKIST